MDAKSSSGPGSTVSTGEATQNSELRRQQREERSKMISDNQKDLQNIKEQQSAAINHLRKTYRQKEQEARVENEKNQQIMHQKAAQEYRKAAEEQNKTEAFRRRQVEESQTALHQESSVYKYEKTKREALYQESLDNLDHQYLEKSKEKDLAIRNLHKETSLAIDKDKMKTQEQRRVLQEDYESQLRKENNFYREEIKNRENYYQAQIQDGELKYQLALAAQKEKYDKELQKKHDSLIEKMQQLENKEDDSFYKVKYLSANLEEDETQYRLVVSVPEHELKNYKVIVQSDKISVTGARHFQDEIKDEMQKASTNQYQTIHQEFALRAPAEKSMMKREYIDGMLIVTVPKKGMV